MLRICRPWVKRRDRLFRLLPITSHSHVHNLLPGDTDTDSEIDIGENIRKYPQIDSFITSCDKSVWRRPGYAMSVDSSDCNCAANDADQYEQQKLAQVSMSHLGLGPGYHKRPSCQRMYPLHQGRTHMIFPFLPRCRFFSSNSNESGSSEKQFKADDMAEAKLKVSDDSGAPHRFEEAISAVPEPNVEGDGVPQQFEKGTSADHIFSVDDGKTNGADQPFKIVIGDWPQLEQKIKDEKQSMRTKVSNFESRFEKFLKPILAASCLLLPHPLDHPSTLFLHKQTFEITNQNPSYLSSFDVMSYWEGVHEDQEWQAFVDHILAKRVYVRKEWEYSFSTVETLMYDHGIKAPEDGSPDEFFKGECDASFNDGVARLSVIIWKGDKIVYSEVYTGVKCETSTEAEAYAAFALLSKAKEMKIEKLLLCSDSRTTCNIISGELSIPFPGVDSSKYLNLMLRSMKRFFKKLVVMWKPRELMVFADHLAKASDRSLESTVFPAQVLHRWSKQLSGFPLFRIERTKDTGREIKKFGKKKVDESYGNNEFDTYFVVVEEELKLQCLAALKQSLNPKRMNVHLQDIASKSNSFKMKLGKFVDLQGEMGHSGLCTSFTDATKEREGSVLEVVLDANIPKEFYYQPGGFHVIFFTPEERMSCTSENHPRTECAPSNTKGNTKGRRDKGSEDTGEGSGESSGESEAD